MQFSSAILYAVQLLRSCIHMSSSSAIAEEDRATLAQHRAVLNNKRNFLPFAIQSWASVARSLCYNWATCYSRLLYCFCYLIRARHCWRKCVESAIL